MGEGERALSGTALSDGGVGAGLYGSLPLDPYGEGDEIDQRWVDLASCRVIVEDGADAEELLAFLGQVGRLGTSRSDHYHLRRTRPNHGDAGEPDLTVYPLAGPAKGGTR